ncbi:FxSxx-COOH cyclophane-containing RiPP peptide [Streptomyces sp. NBC_01429]|uniref:FxSxx-COOH cyclophane-containing RiPP peptide n=1 Tax=Streptomyces sp. NBC_01429 TaxID=2903862 RepID=UPI003FCE2D87
MSEGVERGGQTRRGWQDEARGPNGAERPERAEAERPPPALPDLLALDLAALRTLDHPVLAEILTDLRGRSEQPKETLWGFNNAF